MKKLLLIYTITLSAFLNAAISEQEKFELVQKSAPLLKFHPNDDSSLASADWYIPRCSLEIFKKDGSKATLIPLGLLTPQSLVQKLEEFKDVNRDNKIGEIYLNAGAGKDPNRRTTRKGPGYIKTPQFPMSSSEQHAYYNFVEISDAYAKISYWFFTPYQGNIDIAPGINIFINRLRIGSHEGDWEHIDVRWEKVNNKWQIRDVFFARHGQAKGDLVKRQDVEFVNDAMQPDKNGTHPIAYVALNSHGTYAKDILLLSPDVDKTSSKGPIAFLFGRDKMGKYKLEDYNKQPWSKYIFRWGSDVDKKFGGSPETPHSYGSFGQGVKSKAELIVNGKAAWSLDVKDGKSPYFKIDPRARIKEIDFKVVEPLPDSVKFEVWKRGLFGLNDKKLYGPFELKPKIESSTTPVPANYSDTLYIKTSKEPNFKLELELIE